MEIETIYSQQMGPQSPTPAPTTVEALILRELTKQTSHQRRIADALERLVDLAMEEREASASGDESPATDLAGNPLR